jgi:hypothetical protein
MSYYFSSGHIEAGDQGLGAMPLIFKFTRLGLAGSHRQIWRYAFQSLNSGHLIHTESKFGGAYRGIIIHLANVLNPLLFAFIRFGV